MLRRLVRTWIPLVAFAACASQSAQKQSASELYAAFREPPTETRPFVRWWWNGARVDEQEILRELDVMHAAGIGGVEINTIGMPEGATPESLARHPERPWLGPEWRQMVRVAAEGARARGMTADLIVGSGWPFGGRFLAENEQTQRVRLIKRTVTGPTRFEATIDELAKGNRRGDDEKPSRRRLAFLRLLRAPVGEGAFAPGEDLTPKADASGTVRLDVPEGPHVVYVGLHEIGFTHVKLGAPGADGPVVDHFQAAAVRRYLDQLSSQLGPALGGALGPALRAMFVDSLELDHANWTHDFASEFARRRGYALEPYLPYVLDAALGAGEGPFHDTVRRARQDWALTNIELFHERFMLTYVSWCEQNGVKARIQAYGRETHPLEGSFAPHLPEGETWLWADQVNKERIRIESTSVNKYVSSAAHLTGKSLVSFEAMTNAVPVFRETLEEFKLGLDLSVLAGLNHPIVHGFNYSPPDAGLPGWVRFGSWLNERNAFWPHFRRWADYAARLGTLLRRSVPEAEVAILAPRADEWARHGLVYQPFPEARFPWYQYDLAGAVHAAGYGADFVSESVIQKAKVDGGRLAFGPQAYPVLIVEEAESLEPATMQALVRFVEAGGRVVFVGRWPEHAPGLTDREARDATVRTAVQALRTREGRGVLLVAAPTSGAPADALVAFAADALARIGLAAPVALAPLSPEVSQIRQRAGELDVLFLANRSREAAHGVHVRHVRAQSAGKRAFVWNPETGARTPFEAPVAADGSLAVELGPLESLVLVFEPGAGIGPATPSGTTPLPLGRATELASATPIGGEWTLTLAPLDGGARTERLVPALFDLSKQEGDPVLRDFGGVASYRTTFDAPSGAFDVLDLGTVHGISEVFLNGQPLGVRWYGRHRYAVGNALRPGRNELEVRVSTVLANYMRAQQDNGSERRWAWWAPPIPMGLVGPVTLARAQAN